MIHCTPHPFGVTEKRETCFGNIAVSVVQSYRLWGLFLKTCPLHLRKPLTHYALWFLVQSYFLYNLYWVFIFRETYDQGVD